MTGPLRHFAVLNATSPASQGRRFVSSSSPAKRGRCRGVVRDGGGFPLRKDGK
jgi:hypothetical protein